MFLRDLNTSKPQILAHYVHFLDQNGFTIDMGIKKKQKKKCAWSAWCCPYRSIVCHFSFDYSPDNSGKSATCSTLLQTTKNDMNIALTFRHILNSNCGAGPMIFPISEFLQKSCKAGIHHIHHELISACITNPLIFPFTKISLNDPKYGKIVNGARYSWAADQRQSASVRIP